MRLTYLAVFASLAALAACDGEPTTTPAAPGGGPRLAVSLQSSLYSSQTPTEFLDAAPGWEVGTRFTTSKAGRVTGFRFYRAPGETGTNYGRLWNSAGQRLKQSNPFPSGTGWVTVNLDTPVDIAPGTTYRVSVNTNAVQAKTYAGYANNGPLSGGPLYSDGGYYGQPTGAFPTSGSSSYYFVDVIFQEYPTVPSQPDLWVRNIYPGFGGIVIEICNQGTADAPAANAQVAHWVADPNGGNGTWLLFDSGVAFPAIPANTCYARNYAITGRAGWRNEAHVTADINGVVAESNETNNRKVYTWFP
jgi:hypothetical protein